MNECTKVKQRTTWKRHGCNANCVKSKNKSQITHRHKARQRRRKPWWVIRLICMLILYRAEALAAQGGAAAAARGQGRMTATDTMASWLIAT